MTRPLGIQQPLLPPVTLGLGQYRPNIQLLPLLGSQSLTVLNPALFQGSLDAPASAMFKQASRRPPTPDSLSQKTVKTVEPETDQASEGPLESPLEGPSEGTLGESGANTEETAPELNHLVSEKVPPSEPFHRQAEDGNASVHPVPRAVIQRAPVNGDSVASDLAPTEHIIDHSTGHSAERPSSSSEGSSSEEKISLVQDISSSKVGTALGTTSKPLSSEISPTEPLSSGKLPSAQPSLNNLSLENPAVNDSPSEKVSIARSSAQALPVQEVSVEPPFVEPPSEPLSVAPELPYSEGSVPKNAPAIQRSSGHGGATTAFPEEFSSSQPQPSTEPLASQQFSVGAEAHGSAPQSLAETPSAPEPEPAAPQNSDAGDKAVPMPPEKLQLKADGPLGDGVSPSSQNENISKAVTDGPFITNSAANSKADSKANFNEPTPPSIELSPESELSPKSATVSDQALSLATIQAKAEDAADDVVSSNSISFDQGSADGISADDVSPNGASPNGVSSDGVSSDDISSNSEAGSITDGVPTKGLSDGNPALPTLAKSLKPLSTFTPLDHQSLGLKPLLPRQTHGTNPVNRVSQAADVSSSRRLMGSASPLQASAPEPYSRNLNGTTPISMLQPYLASDKGFSNPALPGSHIARRADVLTTENNLGLNAVTALRSPIPSITTETASATSTETVSTTAAASPAPLATPLANPLAAPSATSMAVPLATQPYPNLQLRSSRPTIYRKASHSSRTESPAETSSPQVELPPQTLESSAASVNGASPADLEKLANHLYQQLKHRLLAYQERQGHYHRRLG